MIRAGLIGFGLAGRSFHAPLLRAAGIRINAVVSRQAEAVASELPDAIALGSDAELFARDDIDLVVIATPNHLHAPQARAALTAGKHVVVDKPMSIDVTEANGLIELARNHKRMLTPFQNRRWDSDFLTIKHLVSSGRLGELTAFHARWDRYRPVVVDRWREHAVPGNGVLYDLGAHLIDQALVSFGMPDWIYADVFTQRPGASAIDGFEIEMAAGRARITLGVSTLAAHGGPRYRVHGASGSFIKSGLDVQEPQLRAGMAANDAQFGIEPEAQWGTFTDGASGESTPIESAPGRWTEFYRQVRACIEENAPPPVPPEAGRDVIRVIEAAIRSSDSGERVALDPK